MKLDWQLSTDSSAHSDVVSVVCWLPAATESQSSSSTSAEPTLLSFGDDRICGRWSLDDGRFLGAWSAFPWPKDAWVTAVDAHWSTVTGAKGQEGGLLMGVSDGRFLILGNRGTRIEKQVEAAHRGPVLAVRWSPDGSALVTGGEDGQVKVWSRTGLLRSALAQCSAAVVSVLWSPEGSQVLYATGRTITIKSLQAGSKPLQWKAHDGAVLCADWNGFNRLIVTAGEDRKYRVWDAYGRQLYSSGVQDHPILSLSWNPSGTHFACGSFDTVRICDRAGWSETVTKPNTGSVFHMAWSHDGSRIACAGGNGTVCIANVVDQRLYWKHLEFVIYANYVEVMDVLNGCTERLDFKGKIVRASVGFDHLILVTATQCYIYNVKAFNTPFILDLSKYTRIVAVAQSSEHFALVDVSHGIQLYTYEGRANISPKFSGMKPEWISHHTLSFSTDMLVVRDTTDEKSIHLFDMQSGKEINPNEPFKHSVEIARLQLAQSGPSHCRLLAFVDRNSDLYVLMPNSVKSNGKQSSNVAVKLASMVDSFRWNESNHLLCAIVDGKPKVWYYPAVVFIDPDILEYTATEVLAAQDFDGNTSTEHSITLRGGYILGFFGTQCLVRRMDGALCHVAGISPYPVILMEVLKKKQADEAVRLCRFVKSRHAWASLAAMSVHLNELNTAEVAYASIDEVKKVEFINHIKEIPSTEGRNALMALFRRSPTEAESILLASGLTWRCIKMWIDLFNWDRALEVAMKYKQHVDTVLYYRQKYLTALDKSEKNTRFLQLANEVKIEPDLIIRQIQNDEEHEVRRQAAR